MSSHILFIYPPEREENLYPDIPPLGLVYMSSFIRRQLRNKYKITLWDLNLHRITREQFEEKLQKLEDKPDIIGIGGIVTVFKHFLWMSEICKEIFPSSLLVAGGSLGSTVPHLLFKHSPVDICVKGEGEHTLLEIIDNLENGASKSDMLHIQGILLWDAEKNCLIETPPRPRTVDLDIFGMPAYDLLDMQQYAANGIRNLKGYIKDLPPQIFSPGNLHMAVTTSRGCTSRCTFCYRQFPKIELNSPAFVKNHLKFLYHEFGINVVSILDELFNISEKRMYEMISCFTEIKHEIPEFYFRIGGARVDLINTESLKKLKESGCFQIIYGLESGSQKMLDMMKKRVTVEQNRKAVIAARDAGLHCVPQFITGLPGEDRDTLKETFKFINSIDFWSYISLHRANAYPGSEIYQYAKDKGLIKNEFEYVSSLAGTNVYPLQLADISAKEIKRMLARYTIMREARLAFKNKNLLMAIFVLIIKLIRGAIHISAKN
jgi:anaerobic magnesium-protoporphyrin IX monomethyl ester cyclase